MSNGSEDIKKYLETLGVHGLPIQENATLTESIETTLAEDNSDVAYELEDIKDQIKGLLDEALSIIRPGMGEGGMARDRAESYWYAHIVMALDSDHGYMGGSMTTMQDTADEIRHNDGDDDEFGDNEHGTDF